MIISGRKLLSVLLILSIAAIIIAVVLLLFNSSTGYGDIIGLVNIDGVIGVNSSGSILSPRLSHLDQIRSAQQDPQLKALLIRINSPGGSSGTSQEIYETILRIRNKGIPVVVSMADTAASGGYYIAAAADYIYANGTTITGSIGVIMEFLNFEELYDKIGVEFEIIKSGQFKDAGHSARSLTETEEQLYQELITDAWDQFVEDVTRARQLSREEVEAVADGRVLTGRQALEVGLIDELGGYDSALEKAKELAGISDTAYIRTYQPSVSWLQRLLSQVSSLSLGRIIDSLPRYSINLKFQ